MATPLSPVDAAWLHMDRATNRMIITAVLLFDDVVPRDALIRRLEERLRLGVDARALADAYEAEM